MNNSMSGRMMPSREFLVRQAILNAAALDMPTTLQREGLSQVLRYNVYEWAHQASAVNASFARRVREQYRALTSRYTNDDEFPRGRVLG